MRVRQIRVAAAQQIGPRLAKKTFHAIGYEEDPGASERESHPTRVPLPKLAAPDQRFRSASAEGWSGNEKKADDEYDDSWYDEGDDDKCGCRDGLLLFVRIGDAGVSE